MFEINLSDFIKKDENTPVLNSSKNPNERTIDELIQKGFFVIDKDCGPTSHSTCDLLKSLLIKHKFKISKVGHSGTLDPKVTGVLVCGLNKSTRLMEYMLLSNKRYISLMYIHKSLDFKIIEKTIKSFVGKIKQLPPIISAVKREERFRNIYSIEILDRSHDNKYILFDVSCERGTYIRKLCSDIGDKLNVKSQMVELRRVKAGPFCENSKNLISLDKLRNLLELYDEDKKYEVELKKYLLPYEQLVKDFKKIIVCDTTIEFLKQGTDLKVPGILYIQKDIKKNDLVAIFSTQNELIAIGKSQMTTKEIKKNEKGNCVKTNKVFIG